MTTNQKLNSNDRCNFETRRKEFIEEFKNLSGEEMFDVVAILEERKRCLELKSITSDA